MLRLVDRAADRTALDPGVGGLAEESSRGVSPFCRVIGPCQVVESCASVRPRRDEPR